MKEGLGKLGEAERRSRLESAESRDARTRHGGESRTTAERQSRLESAESRDARTRHGGESRTTAERPLRHQQRQSPPARSHPMAMKQNPLRGIAGTTSTLQASRQPPPPGCADRPQARFPGAD